MTDSDVAVTAREVLQAPSLGQTGCGSVRFRSLLPLSARSMYERYPNADSATTIAWNGALFSILLPRGRVNQDGSSLAARRCSSLADQVMHGRRPERIKPFALNLFYHLNMI
jgi:hypothetical protein